MPVYKQERGHHVLAPPAYYSTSSPNIKGQLRCIFSRTTRPITPLNPNDRYRQHRSKSAGNAHQREYQKSRTKRKKSTHLGHEEENRIMRILHSLEDIDRRGTAKLRKELTHLYIKPLPEYIQDKLKYDNEKFIEEKGMSQSAILFEELFENVSLDDPDQLVKDPTLAEKILLPDPKPHTTSKWQQKMLSKLEKLENSSNNHNAGTVSQKQFFHPHLNRQLQVQGQGSSCCTKNNYSPPRYKPPVTTHSTSPPQLKKTAFSYSDPMPEPVNVISTKEILTPFEERILQLEKMEKDSILMEKSSKPRSSTRELTSRIPTALMTQPKYLDSTLAFQSKVSPRKTGSNLSSTKTNRAITPTNGANGNNSRSYERRKSNSLTKDILAQRRRASNKVSIAAKS